MSTLTAAQSKLVEIQKSLHQLGVQIHELHQLIGSPEGGAVETMADGALKVLVASVEAVVEVEGRLLDESAAL